jgi:hypothetical protein
MVAAAASGRLLATCGRQLDCQDHRAEIIGLDWSEMRATAARERSLNESFDRMEDNCGL